MWHPVGPLPAGVYWRRRLVVLTVLVAVIGGVGWLTVTVLAARDERARTSAAASAPVQVPALERVVPPVSTVATPTPPDAAAAAAAAARVHPPGPSAGGPCADDMISVEVRTPGAAAVGGGATFELVVTNVSAVPCVRALDKGLQEIQLFDAAGTRIWGSNDCFPESGTETRTLLPGDVVTFPVVWGGLVSEPTCTAPRNPPAAGTYVARGRLDTKVSGDALLTLG